MSRPYSRASSNFHFFVVFEMWASLLIASLVFMTRSADVVCYLKLHEKVVQRGWNPNFIEVIQDGEIEEQCIFANVEVKMNVADSSLNNELLNRAQKSLLLPFFVFKDARDN